jgi:mannose-6-phosphate isomerase-like protein (cupin superfamily)
MKNREIWITGHKLISHDTSGDYDIAVLESAVGVPGPPPHYHTTYNELFLVLEGEMEFIVDGKKINLGPGDSIDLKMNQTHTFKNVGNSTCRYVNIHSPKGFSAFFNDMGISADEENARERSTSQEQINKLIENAEKYDMHIRM